MRIGLLTSRKLTEFQLKTIEPVLTDPAFSIQVVVMDYSPKKTLKQKLIKNLKRGRGGYIFLMALSSFKKKVESFDTKNICQVNNITFIKAKNLYSTSVINQLKKYKLDVLLLLGGGFGIIKKPLLDLPAIGVLSYHHGDMRKYRGMPPAFWELFNGEKEMGITVQILAQGLDCGIPVQEKKVNIRKDDTLSSLKRRVYSESTNMMHEALQKLLHPDFTGKKIKKFGKVYTLPNLRQWLSFQNKIIIRRLKKKFL